MLTDELRNSHDANVVVITGVGCALDAGGCHGEVAKPEEGRLRRMFAGLLRILDEIRQNPGPGVRSGCRAE